MPSKLVENCRIIREHEFNFARRLAKGVLQRPKISVWLILVPVLFIYYVRRIKIYKADLQRVCDGVVHTKNFALDAAAAELQGEAVPDFRKQFLGKHPNPTRKVEEVFSHQAAEIELLMAHYRRLLAESAEDFSGLVRGVYKAKRSYREFLEMRGRAEEKLGTAVVEAFQSGEEARAVHHRMVKLARELREEELLAVFS